MRNGGYSAAFYEEAAQLYASGLSMDQVLDEMRKRHGSAPYTFALGEQLRKRNMTRSRSVAQSLRRGTLEKRVQAIRMRVESQAACREIAQELGVNRKTVTEWLSIAGVGWSREKAQEERWKRSRS
jgi:hypothetical protein